MFTTDYCPVCPRDYQPISGDGPRPAEVLGIAERPGEQENKEGIVLVGKSGQEINYTYFPLAGLHRSQVRLCNAVSCWATANRTPTDKELWACANHHLPAELTSTRPDVVILIGSSAHKLDQGVLKLDSCHGVPRKVDFFLGIYNGWVISTYHPAAALRETRLMTQCLEDWESIGRFIGGSYRPPVSPVSNPEYKLLTTPEEVNHASLCSPVAIDTENHGSKAYSIQYSFSPNRAYMVLSEAQEAMSSLQEPLGRSAAILHNASHDLKVMGDLGLAVHSFSDTMQEAYHFGDLPQGRKAQGLKPLVFRLFGQIMTSWEDVVYPASISALQNWISEALDIAISDLQPIRLNPTLTCARCTHGHSRHGAQDHSVARNRCNVKNCDCPGFISKHKEVSIKSPLEALLLRLLQHTDVASDYDPWERLTEFWTDSSNEWMTSHVESRIGSYPILGIGNAPLDRAITYACGDALWTREVSLELAKRRQDPYFYVSEEDVDR